MFVATLAINPLVLPQRSDIAEFLAAVPEFALNQTEGVLRLLLVHEVPLVKRFLHRNFVN